jgi:hypothetical protein
MKFRKVAAALTFAALVATGMFTSSARLHAQGPSANTGICGRLAVLASLADSVDAALAQQIRDYAASIGCPAQ